MSYNVLIIPHSSVNGIIVQHNDINRLTNRIDMTDKAINSAKSAII